MTAMEVVAIIGAVAAAIVAVIVALKRKCKK